MAKAKKALAHQNCRQTQFPILKRFSVVKVEKCEFSKRQEEGSEKYAFKGGDDSALKGGYPTILLMQAL